MSKINYTLEDWNCLIEIHNTNYSIENYINDAYFKTLVSKHLLINMVYSSFNQKTKTDNLKIIQSFNKKSLNKIRQLKIKLGVTFEKMVYIIAEDRNKL